MTATVDVTTQPLLRVRNLRVERQRGDERDTIVSDVSLSLAAAETIGIVGESGSGKSITARAITGLLPPTISATGEVGYEGRNLLALGEGEWRGIRGREIGMVLQDPFTMLNPVLRCGTILGESLRSERRLSRAEQRSEAVRRLAEVGIADASVIDRYPFQLSGGMRQRVALAAALARDPRVLIADEPSTALDVRTQAEILALIKSIQTARGMALILITHDLRVAFEVCERIHVLYAGSLVEVAPAPELETEPLHPYSQGLLLSEAPVDRRLRQLNGVPGSVPSVGEVAGRCVFEPRCRWARDVCRQGAPRLRELEAGRLSACVRIDEIRADMATFRQQAESEVAPVPPPRTDAPLILARDLRKTFQHGSGVVAALDGVSIEVGPNESVGLVGESGSGKTTLARSLIGLEQPSSGSVTIDGIDASDWTRLSGADRRRLRGTVQVVFQDPYSSLNPMRSIGWTLREAVGIHEPAIRNRRARVEELLQLVGLPVGYAERRPVALSGGERQRVAIARALAANPSILICDEPVSALDVSVQAQVLNLFTRLRSERGLGYLFITHDLSIVRQVTDVVYVMYRGRIVESGPTDEVLDNPQEPYTVQLLEAVPGAADRSRHNS